jgi:glycosyltransferase involved in cell wall biosynthesis
MILADAATQNVRYARDAGADGIVGFDTPPRWSPRRAVSAALVRWQRYNWSLESTLRRARVQIVVGETLSWRLGSVATVSWLQDFQHRSLPALFDARETARRERIFRDTMRLADRALAMSAAVADDARRLAPDRAPKLRVVRPLTLIEPSIYARDPIDVTAKFGIPARFFYVPNQFWVHKNHTLLFQSLHVLRERNVEPHVVLTGRSEDYRSPDHFDSLMHQVAEWNLTGQVHYLGVVERDDVYDLIRQSICVVNPSLFEGWGYAVDEAAAIGKRILASDLPSHREQNAPECTYFEASDVHQLAGHLECIWRDAQPGPDATLEAAARAHMPDRVRTLGQSLCDVFDELVNA